MDAHSLIALISEVLTLVGLVVGGVLYALGVAVRGIKGGWVATDGVIASHGPAMVIRWFDGTGEVHERPADTHETTGLAPGEDVPVWYHSRNPSRGVTHAPESEGKGLRVTGLILLGVGAVSAVIGFVLMFV
jgi:hypothetical protein